MRLTRWRAIWRRMSPLDCLALAVAVLYVAMRVARPAGFELPGSPVLGILFLAALAYGFVRLLPRVRSQLLWSLRNRLIVAYVFIAVVPVVLLLAMAGLSSYLLYLQLGAHLLHDDLQNRISDLTSVAEAIDGALLNGKSAGRLADQKTALALPGVSGLLDAASRELPGIRLEVGNGKGLLKEVQGAGTGQFAGIVQAGGKLWLKAVIVSYWGSGPVAVSVSAPLSPELLDGLASDLGPIQLTALRPATKADTNDLILPIGDERFVPEAQISSQRRILQSQSTWYDIQVKGISTIDALYFLPGGGKSRQIPVVASFSVRPSQLNHRLFASLGAWGGPLIFSVLVIGVVFLLLELGALITGVVLTRTITETVAELYEATQLVRRGDFRHRVRVKRRDQLGALGESFNAMTGSLAELIEEQRQRQKLENELSIAREVQTQLFPKSLPEVRGVKLAAICRAARVVSGDYYDLLRLGPERLGIAVADISGKGISAALLMASLQAALRSQALLDGQGGTGELVARLNEHLFHNTSDDRYATFFYAVYDAQTRRLSYTNAGHVAPFYVAGEHVQKLEEGGTVVGLFDNCEYTQGMIEAAPESFLVAFSDGLIEPENVYGEEFGSWRLRDEVLRHRAAPAERMAESLLAAVEQWSGTSEPFDDMTVVVARMD